MILYCSFRCQPNLTPDHGCWSNYTVWQSNSKPSGLRAFWSSICGNLLLALFLSLMRNFTMKITAFGECEGGKKVDSKQILSLETTSLMKKSANFQSFAVSFSSNIVGMLFGLFGSAVKLKTLFSSHKNLHELALWPWFNCLLFSLCVLVCCIWIIWISFAYHIERILWPLCKRLHGYDL